MKPETKLGIFTVIGLFVLGFSLYFLGGFSITRTYDVNIKFQDVSGLSEVRILRTSESSVKHFFLPFSLPRKVNLSSPK